MPLTKASYLKLRNKYKPKCIRLVLIAESPPASGLYFYDASGSVTEPLFKALMGYIGFKALPPTKEKGLHKFQEKGWILVDATYEPVNKLHNGRQKAEVIKRDYRLLRRDLENLGSPPSVLIKKNVCQILEPMLADDGFDVLNRGRVVYFPVSYHLPAFHRQFGEILKRNRKLLCLR